MEGNLARVSASSALSPIGYIRAEPTTGRTKLIGMFAGSLFLGLVVGLTLVVLCEWADHSLRYGADTERVLGVPVLAVVPEAVQLRVVHIGAGAGQGGLKNGGMKKARRPPTIEDKDEMGVSALEGVQ